MTKATRSAATLGAALAVAALAILPAQARNQNCTVSSFRFNAGGETLTTMWVRRGTGCQIHFEVGNSTQGLVGIVSSTIAVRPKGGRLGNSSPRLYAYVPNPDFAGDDEFAITIRYDQDDGKGIQQTLLRAKVSVY